MNLKSEKIKNILESIILPIILLLYPLIMINQGVDLSDTTYSLVNYLYFPEMTGAWKYATYLANALGYGLIHLVHGRMLYMNLLTGLIVSCIALLCYYQLGNKFNKYLLFISEIVAICLCWCPTIILYNYLSYLLLTGAIVCIWNSLEKEKKWLLLPAGILLGINVFVRASNLTQMILILVIWYDVLLKKNRKIWEETGICILGYILGLGSVFLVLLISEGSQGLLDMYQWLFGMLSSGQDAGGYSMSAMLGTIIENYVGNLKWLAMLMGAAILGVGGFCIFKDRFVWVKRIGYLICICVLFVYFYRNGMFNTRYYNVGSIYCIAVVLIMVSWIVCGYAIVGKHFPIWLKRMAMVSFLLLIILPLGSNNHLYSVMNYLFLIVPSVFQTCYIEYQRIRDKLYCFPVMSVLISFGILLVLQTSLFHSQFVFCDGTDGVIRDYVFEDSSVMQGMRTNYMHADNMHELKEYLDCLGTDNTQLLLFGNIPGLSYYLERPVAISTSWPDLESYDQQLFADELSEITSKPIVIIKTSVANEMLARVQMEIAENSIEKNQSQSITAKQIELNEYLEKDNYEITFINQEFTVFMAK